MKKSIKDGKNYYQSNKSCRIWHHNYWQKNKLRLSEYYLTQRKELKKLVLTHYGKGKLKCSICSEKRVDCLSIDHINGNGTRQRKEIGGSGYHIYRWLEKNDFPEGYRTLCMNCQFIEGIKNMKHEDKLSQTIK